MIQVMDLKLSLTDVVTQRVADFSGRAEAQEEKASTTGMSYLFGINEIKSAYMHGFPEEC